MVKMNMRRLRKTIRKIKILVVMSMLFIAVIGCKGEKTASQSSENIAEEETLLEKENTGNLCSRKTELLKKNLSVFENAEKVFLGELGENVRLVGFTDTKIYGVRNETDKGNGVTDTVYLAFNRKNPEEAIELYIGNFSYILLEEVLEDTLYVMNAQMTENMDNPWLITLYMLGQNGKEEIVYSTRTLTIPQVWHNSTSFFVCAESKDSSLVSYIDVINPAKEADRVSTIVYNGFQRDQEGRITGEFILYGGGDDHYIYYQNKIMEEEVLDENRDVSVVEYDLKENLSGDVLYLKNGLSRHISGNPEYILMVQYVDDIQEINQQNNTVIFINKNSLDLWELPETPVGFEVYLTLWLDDNQVVLQNYKSAFLVDLEEKSYVCWDEPGYKISIYDGQYIGGINEKTNEFYCIDISQID